MFRQLNHISSYTLSILINIKKEDHSSPSNQLIAYWITETQKGLDAFFNDEYELATTIFQQHLEESPFHAVGYALMSYVEALLCFETEKIQIALQRITAAELLAKRFLKKAKRKSWSHYYDSLEAVDIYYELVVLNCMLMHSTLQFLRNNWVEYVKAAYKLRKAYKLYESMFELVTGKKTSVYAALCNNNKKKSTTEASSKRSSCHNNRRKRPISSTTATMDTTILEATVESGVYFGIGLFTLVFSLLPPKVNKLLNTLGFQSSRPFALHLLQKSFYTKGLYSCLSAISLICYYTNLSMFIHPQLLPTSLCLQHIRVILDQMILSHPRGNLWKLFEGKLCKMEGKTRKGVEILRDARRNRVRMDMTTGATKVIQQHTEFLSSFAQLQALTVYEMGWGQIFLGDYFQAAETFFRLESINSWSRVFYHYIATSCMFADEEYDKAAFEYRQIPSMLKRRQQGGHKLLPNEVFVERKIRRWCHDELTGVLLKRVVVVNPLWELIYLWNGVSQLTKNTLMHMKQSILETISTETIDLPQLYLLLGVCVRELGDLEKAEEYLKKVIEYEEDVLEDQWVIPHSLYEMAALCCFKIIKLTDEDENRKRWCKEAHDWIKKSERFLVYGATQQQQDTLYSDNSGDADWDSRLHVKCQLLKEKLEDFNRT